MRGSGHYDEAERLVDAARDVVKKADAAREGLTHREALVDWDSAHQAARTLLMIADIHATLGLAAAVQHAGPLAGSGYGE